MASFTLDDIRAAADKKYGSTEIAFGDGEIVVLQNALRLDKKTRDKLVKLQDEMSDKDDDKDIEELLAESLRLVATDAKKADALIEEIGGDLGVLVGVFESYSNQTDLGEASASES